MVRNRTRGMTLEAEVPAEVQSDSLREMAQDLFAANKAKNEAASLEKKAKEKLHKAMIKANTDRVEFTGHYKGVGVLTEAVIEPTVSEYIDPGLMRDLVDDDDFMAMVSITKTDANKIVGEDIVIRSTKSETKPASLKLRKVAD